MYIGLPNGTAFAQGCDQTKPSLLPRWQPSLQPNLQLESPFLWPLLSMCSSLR